MSNAEDPMKVCNNLDLLHPYTKKCALEVLERAEAEGLSIGVFETVRSLTRRKYLVSIGNSKSINSYHGLGLAVDFVFKTAKGNWTWERPKEDWDKLAKILDECGFTPGWWWKSFKDGPHGQIDFNKFSSTMLYAKLKECGEDLNKFYLVVDGLLRNDAYHYKRFSTESQKPVVEEPKVLEVVEPQQVALNLEKQESAPFLVAAIQFIASLFKGK